jgi:hypothetical protein
MKVKMVSKSKKGLFGVFGGELQLSFFDYPVNTQSWVIKRDTTITLRAIVIVDFVGKSTGFAQHYKSMGKTTGDQHLTFVFT